MKPITLLLLVTAFTVNAETNIDTVVTSGVNRNNQAIAGQNKMDAIAKQTDKLETEYRSVLKINADLKVYNSQLKKQIVQQKDEMVQISESLERSGLIERQIGPTMIKMIEALEAFVPIDMPFDKDFRVNRVKELRSLLDRGDVEINEKFRKVAEVYMSEIEYGRTVSTYRQTVSYEGKDIEVNILRVGRISLVFQNDDRNLTVAWNKETDAWEQVSSFAYKNAIANAFKVAKKQKSPEFIVVPVQKTNLGG